MREDVKYGRDKLNHILMNHCLFNGPMGKWED